MTTRIYLFTSTCLMVVYEIDYIHIERLKWIGMSDTRLRWRPQRDIYKNLLFHS
ncbi:hypothetical protein Hanom_Chr10g00926551 [Helianthus anomalus]